MSDDAEQERYAVFRSDAHPEFYEGILSKRVAAFAAGATIVILLPGTPVLNPVCLRARDS